MVRSLRFERGAVAAVFTLVLLAAAPARAIQVQSLSPARNTMAPTSAAVAVTFDVAVLTSSITSSSFRVFGRGSGAPSGTFTFSNGNRTVTFTRSRRFSAGEWVNVNLSHEIRAADLTPLRAAGYAYSFWARTGASSMVFDSIDAMTNRTNDIQTRIYGASTSDLNEDGFLDLTTVNEVSADVRVFLNRADGTGFFQQPFLTPQAIGVEASPNESADLDNDGHADLVVVAVESNSVWTLLGAGNGTYSTITEIPVGTWPHGCTVLDVDGDGDMDIVNSNNADNDLSLHLNNGNGTFAAQTRLDSGTSGEYGMAAGDMNNDGIADLVVCGRDDARIVTLLGNGNGTFTAAGATQPSGGATWQVTLGDLNGDGFLDATTANSSDANGAALIGLGNGRFGAPAIAPMGAHTVATDLGDLDGDGDLDWVVSSFGAGLWRVFRNNGAGVFTFDQDIAAVSNPSCAILLDFDNDQDLDLALSDEIADLVVLRKNRGTPASVEGPIAQAADVLLAAPNPFRDATVIRFRLREAGGAELNVYDLEGRLVASERLQSLRSGWNTHRFNGRGSSGAVLPNGLYLVALRSAEGARFGRMTLLH